MAKAILYDSTKCTGCRGCQVACKQWNGLLAEETINRGTYENPPDLSPDTWIKMKFREHDDPNAPGGLTWLFTRQACMHCTDAACVKVCPSGALSHNPLGFVQYQKDKCTGCGYCVEFCPFEVPRMRGSKITGIRKMEKCLFCADRVSEGYEPACVKACPTEALQFGNRRELLAIGWQRVEAIKETYPQARLYGANEMGGLHVMYVLPYPPEVHGLPANPQPPAAAMVHDVIQWVGVGAAVAVAAGLGLNLMVTRARMISEQEGK